MSEVVTFAAGTTAHLVNKYHIHAMPVDWPTLNLKADADTRFFAFRGPKGGHMTKLFKRALVAVVQLDPTEHIQEQLDQQQAKISEQWCDALYDFIEGLQALPIDKRRQYRAVQNFHLMELAEELPHQPKPEKNGEASMPYTLEQIRTLEILP